MCTLRGMRNRDMNDVIWPASHVAILLRRLCLREVLWVVAIGPRDDVRSLSSTAWVQFGHSVSTWLSKVSRLHLLAQQWLRAASCVIPMTIDVRSVACAGEIFSMMYVASSQ